MAKGPPISDEVKMYVAKLHKEHPKWTNMTIRNEVSFILHKKNPSLPEAWPSKFAIDRIMPGIREQLKRSKAEPNPVDRPWTVQSMGNSEHQIPPEALPSVLKVWFYVKNKGYDFTIRDAQWVGRLYAAIKDVKALYNYALTASMVEILAEMAGIDDFTGLEVVNLSIFSEMEHRIITSEEAKRVAGTSEWPLPSIVGQTFPYLLPSTEETIGSDMSKVKLDRVREVLEETESSEEVRNARKHKAKRQE